MRLLSIYLLLVFSSFASAELYKWTDEKGNIHFSDKPHDDKAEPYTPPPIQTVPAGPAADFSKQEKKHVPIKYESITMVSPNNDEVFFPDTKSIAIGVQVKPSIDVKAGHQVVIYLNGEVVRQGLSTRHIARNLPRGTYTATAAVVDKQGNPVMSSGPVVFHVKRHHR